MFFGINTKNKSNYPFLLLSSFFLDFIAFSLFNFEFISISLKNKSQVVYLRIKKSEFKMRDNVK